MAKNILLWSTQQYTKVPTTRLRRDLGLLCYRHRRSWLLMHGVNVAGSGLTYSALKHIRRSCCI